MSDENIMISEEIRDLKTLDTKCCFQRLRELILRSDNPKETPEDLYKIGITKINPKIS